MNLQFSSSDPSDDSDEKCDENVTKRDAMWWRNFNFLMTRIWTFSIFFCLHLRRNCKFFSSSSSQPRSASSLRRSTTDTAEEPTAEGMSGFRPSGERAALAEKSRDSWIRPDTKRPTPSRRWPSGTRSSEGSTSTRCRPWCSRKRSPASTRPGFEPRSWTGWSWCRLRCRSGRGCWRCSKPLWSVLLLVLVSRKSFLVSTKLEDCFFTNFRKIDFYFKWMFASVGRSISTESLRQQISSSCSHRFLSARQLCPAHAHRHTPARPDGSRRLPPLPVLPPLPLPLPTFLQPILCLRPSAVPGHVCFSLFCPFLIWSGHVALVLVAGKLVSSSSSGSVEKQQQPLFSCFPSVQSCSASIF